MTLRLLRGSRMNDTRRTDWLAADTALNEAVHSGDCDEIASATEKLQEIYQELDPQEDD